MLGGFPQVFPPGARFAYNNGGYVVLALLAERAAGVPFRALVARARLRARGHGDTSFLRGDEPDGDVALGYLEADGAADERAPPARARARATAASSRRPADVHALWRALFAGRIVAARARARRWWRSRSDAGELRYGLGFWLAPRGGAVALVGSDAGRLVLLAPTTRSAAPRPRCSPT